MTSDFCSILTIINDAAQAYRGVIPEDRWNEPYMTDEELRKEIDDGVEFFGSEKDGVLRGVMGIQNVRDATLIRHAYVLTNHQREGIGKELLNHLLKRAQTSEIFVGTWKAALWAIRFYEKNRFVLVPKAEKNRLLREYWSIPERQVETSVVLKLNEQSAYS